MNSLAGFSKTTYTIEVRCRHLSQEHSIVACTTPFEQASAVFTSVPASI